MTQPIFTSAAAAEDWVRAQRRPPFWGNYIPKSPERTAAIVCLFRAGVSMDDIAHALNLSWPYIKKILRDEGVVEAAPYTTSERNTMIYEARKAGERLGAIARAHGISIGRVRQICANGERRERQRTAREQAAEERAAEAERVRVATEAARVARYERAVAAGIFVPVDRFAQVHTPESERAAILGERA